MRDAAVRVPGYLVDRDDFNPGPVPYRSMRGGHIGNCHSTNYRAGAEYVFFLFNSASPWGPELTPYWAALAPTHEQIQDSDDLWLLWVREEIARQGRPK